MDAVFHFDSSLEQSVTEALVALRSRYPGCHIEWDLDRHDRLVIADIQFADGVPDLEWIDAISSIMDDHRMAAVAPLGEMRRDIVDAFARSGYVFDSEGTGLRNGLCLRDVGAERAVTANIRELDGRFRHVYFEWAFTQDGALLLRHLESGRNPPEEGVEEYLEALREFLADAGMKLEIDEAARTEWLEARLEAAGFLLDDDGLQLPLDDTSTTHS